MEQHTFKSRREYVRAQQKVTRKNISKSGHKCFVTQPEIDTICRYHKDNREPLDYGLCHGVRMGEELTLFKEAFGRGVWFGTEIVPELCDGLRVLNILFDIVPVLWVDRFDLIYSNSLDHSRQPKRTIKKWLSCLNEDGLLYIEWTPWHNKLGARGNKGDCFAASLDEYRELLSANGTIEQVLTVPDFSKKLKEPFKRYVFAVSRS